MCIGEGSLDTIGRQEQEDLRAAATEELPKHLFGTHVNDEGIAWIVLEPAASKAGLPRFTICRIAPCLVVMVEDAAGRRRFGSVDGVEGAMAFVRSTVDEATLANRHSAHAMVQ